MNTQRFTVAALLLLGACGGVVEAPFLEPVPLSDDFCEAAGCCEPDWCVDYATCTIYQACDGCIPKPADIPNGVDDDCDGAIDEGETNICVNIDCGDDGTCVAIAGIAACDCDEGYEPDGLTCIAISLCRDVDCGHGVCAEDTEGAWCECEHRYDADGLSCIPDPTCDCVSRCAGAADGCGGTCASNDCDDLCCDLVCCAPGQLCGDAGECCTPQSCLDYATCQVIQTCDMCADPPARDGLNNIDDDCDGWIDEDVLDRINPFPGRPALWLEAGSANESTGYGLHTPVVFALRGYTPDAYNLRILHPLYHPYIQPMSIAQVRAWARAQLADAQVDGLGLDHETWTLSMGASILQVLYEEAEAAGKVFCDVPKISLDHAIAGTSTFAQRVALINQYTHCVSPWSYSCDGDEYLAYVQAWRHYGYTKQILPMGDPGHRPENGSITPAIAVNTVHTLADHGLSFALFLPKYDTGVVLEAMRQRYP